MATSPVERLEADLRTSMKAGEKERVSTLRMLLAETKNDVLRGGAGDEAAFARVVQKAIRQRKEAAEQFLRGERSELAAKEEREAVILATYLPAQLDEATLRAAIVELVASERLSGPQATGTVVKTMMARFAGQAEGATISRLARDVLAGR